MVSTAKSTEILYVSFNQDQGCISVGTQNGFKVYSTNPFKETFYRDLGGGIGIVEMLYRCNILALVGGGSSPKYPPNKVMLWDDHQSKCIAELCFRTDVKGLRLKADKIIVVLETKIYVYNFSDIKLIDHIETVKNPKGLFSLNNNPETTVLACLAKDVGHVAIHAYGIKFVPEHVLKLLDTKKTISLRAHQSQVGSMELDYPGKKLATSSEKGTIIRIFDTEEGHLIHEVRRGSDYAQICSISFDSTSKWLACCSDNCTIHIFSLKDKAKEDRGNEISEEEAQAKNSKSKFAFLKVVSSYFGSEWSLAQFKIPDRRAKLVFDPDTSSHSLYVVGYEGNYYILNYDQVNGGECMKQFEGKITDSTA